MQSEWRDGFLFVGNHLVLDFLNTRPVMDGQPMELLPDASALAKWLGAAGLVTPAQAARLGKKWSGSIGEIQSFRERLRRVVIQMEAGESASASFVSELNRLLAQYPEAEQVFMGELNWERRKRFDPQVPLDVFAPLASATSGLLTDVDSQRIRQCRNCVVHFYDASKRGTRVWCSMNLCGNRSKVAAHSARQRASS
ncbi:MAG: ABATE domain-containing protein [Bryobacteraceae bacterium]